MLVYEAQAREEERRRKVVECSTTRVPVGSLVLVRLSPQDRADYPSKFVPSFMGPWVVVEQFVNGTTYRVRDLAFTEERQVTKDQFKVLDLPGDLPDVETRPFAPLPRMNLPEYETRVGFVEEKDTGTVESVSTEVENSLGDQLVTEGDRSPEKPVEPVPAPVERYGLRPVAVRRAQPAEERYANVLGRAGTARG